MTGGRPGGPEFAALLDGASRLPDVVSLWAGALDLVHLDAPVRVVRPEPLDPLQRLLLRAVESAPAGLEDLDARLGLGRGPLFRWLGELCAAGLIRLDDRYAVTAAGSAALADGTAPRPATERRRFTFVVGGDGIPRFLGWTAPPAAPLPAPQADARWVAECVARPAVWKRQVGFPEDVLGADLPTDAPPAAAWRRLTVASGERPAVAVALTGDGGLSVHGADASPTARIDAGWEEIFPEVVSRPTEPRADVGRGWMLLGAGRLRRAERVAS